MDFLPEKLNTDSFGKVAGLMSAEEAYYGIKINDTSFVASKNRSILPNNDASMCLQNLHNIQSK